MTNQNTLHSARRFHITAGHGRQTALYYTQRLYMASAESKAIMDTTTVNISFQESLLVDIDKIARVESRSRSELLREAARLHAGQLSENDQKQDGIAI